MNARSDSQRRPRQQRPHGAHFHVIYWEGGDPDGIRLEGPGHSRRSNSQPLPYFCNNCKSVVRPWRYRLDNLQACVRACGKEGCCFRPEAAEFLCLSPKMAIRYEFPKFYSYLTNQTSRALTEKTVLGAAMSVHRGDVTSEECGVTTAVLGPEEDEGEWDVWLEKYLVQVRDQAKGSNGRSVALVLDRDGVELLTLDTGQDPGLLASKLPPIERVVILLGGPSGMESDVQGKMEQLLGGILDNSVRIRLPGGLQHSNVVLADLFMANERWSLLPSVQQLIRCGRDNYNKWREVAQVYLAEMQAACGTLSVEEVTRHLRSSQQQLVVARGKWPAAHRRVVAERPNAWAKGAGTAGKPEPAALMQQPYDAAYPQLSSMARWSQPIAYGDDFWDIIRTALRRKEKKDDTIRTQTNQEMTMEALANYAGDELKSLFPISVQVQAQRQSGGAFMTLTGVPVSETFACVNGSKPHSEVVVSMLEQNGSAVTNVVPTSHIEVSRTDNTARAGSQHEASETPITSAHATTSAVVNGTPSLNSTAAHSQTTQTAVDDAVLLELDALRANKVQMDKALRESEEMQRELQEKNEALKTREIELLEQVASLRSHNHPADEKTETGPDLVEPPSVSSEADEQRIDDDDSQNIKAEHIALRHERAELLREPAELEELESSAPMQEQQPTSQVDNSMEESSSTKRQQADDGLNTTSTFKREPGRFNWADQDVNDDFELERVDDSPKVSDEMSAKVDDDHVDCPESENATSDKAAPPNDETATDDTAIAQATEESNSLEAKTEEVVAPPATKKQWAVAKKEEKKSRKDSVEQPERTEEDPPPLPEQEWPSLGNLGGPSSKKGKRK